MAKQGEQERLFRYLQSVPLQQAYLLSLPLLYWLNPYPNVAIKFGPADYFSLMLLGLCAVSGLAGKSITKALIMTVFGLLLSTIGMDTVSGVAKIYFWFPLLYSGLEFLTIAVGLFALGEVFKTILGE